MLQGLSARADLAITATTATPQILYIPNRYIQVPSTVPHVGITDVHSQSQNRYIYLTDKADASDVGRMGNIQSKVGEYY